MSKFGSFTREPAKRVFARELIFAQHTFKESDDDKAPTMHLLPTGDKCNRVLIIGSLIQKEKKGETNLIYTGKVTDPTGTFYVSAGNYQPEAMQQMAKIQDPSFVAIVGKPNFYQTPDGKNLLSIRIETIVPATEDLRNQWILDTAEQTANRIDTFDNSPYKAMVLKEYGEPDHLKFKLASMDALKSIQL